MSHVEIRQNINELKAELLNQYGAVIVFLADWDPYVQQLKVEVVRDKSMPIKTVKEKIKSIQSIKFSNLESVERIKFHKIKDDFEEGETLVRLLLFLKCWFSQVMICSSSQRLVEPTDTLTGGGKGALKTF